MQPPHTCSSRVKSSAVAELASASEKLAQSCSMDTQLLAWLHVQRQQGGTLLTLASLVRDWPEAASFTLPEVNIASGQLSMCPACVLKRCKQAPTQQRSRPYTAVPALLLPLLRLLLWHKLSIYKIGAVSMYASGKCTHRPPQVARCRILPRHLDVR